jgi:hypothetical protein
MKSEWLADSGDDLYNAVSSAACYKYMCLMFYFFFKIVVLFYISIFFIKAAYQLTLVGALVVVHVPQFEKSWARRTK